MRTERLPARWGGERARIAGRWEEERITEVTDQDFERRRGVRSWEILPWPPRRRTCGLVGDMVVPRVVFGKLGPSGAVGCEGVYVARYGRGSRMCYLVARSDRKERRLLKKLLEFRLIISVDLLVAPENSIDHQDKMGNDVLAESFKAIETAETRLMSACFHATLVPSPAAVAATYGSFGQVPFPTY